MTDDRITSIVANNLCTGCGLCAGAFPTLIRMVEDAEHGRRPVVEQTAEGHRAAQEAAGYCAGASTDWTDLPLQDDVDQEWGPVLATWEGWASDDEMRHRGSSGGAVTALAAFAIENGTASGVAHITARKDDPRLNKAVISRDRDGLLRAAGSRYAQASPAETVAAIAENAEQVVFVGKPCDVASVRKFANATPEIDARIPLTIAIFCAGAPNLNATEKLLDRLGVPKTARLTDVRYRGNGWPGLMQADYLDEDGTAKTSEGISYGAGWGGILQSSRRWRCRVCSDHTGAFADISVGDPWHNPPKGNTDAGQSLIVARTARGRAFVEQAIRDGAIVAEPRDRDVIARAQPNLLATHGAVWGRRLALRAVGLPAPKDLGQNLFQLWRALPPKEKVQSVLGTWKRVLRERLWRKISIRAAQ